MTERRIVDESSPTPSIRIADLFGQGRPLLSFEFSGPKTDEAERSLEKVLAQLAELSPDFTSITYGAMGTTRDRTRDAVVRANRDHPFPTMAHLTCVGHTRADIGELLDDYADAGVRNILALGGDPPVDGAHPAGDFTYAVELVELVRAHPAGFSIGVAAHPEKHPRSPDLPSDRQHLARKLEIADFAVTQFFYDVTPYRRMVDELGDLGCTKPVVPGLMLWPFASVAGLRRMAGINDTTIGPDLDARLTRLDGDRDALRELSIAIGTELGQALLDAGAPGLHLYTLNTTVAATAVATALGLARPRA